MRHSEKNSMDEHMTIIYYKNIMHANLAYTIPIYPRILTTARSLNIVKCSQLCYKIVCSFKHYINSQLYMAKQDQIKLSNNSTMLSSVTVNASIGIMHVWFLQLSSANCSQTYGSDFLNNLDNLLKCKQQMISVTVC